MKTKLIFSILLAAFLLPAMSLKLMSSTPDTAWTVTLPENQYVGSARFSNDDSLLKVRIAVLSGDGTTVDSSIYVNYNSYTGEAVDTILPSNNQFPKNVSIGTFKPQTDLVYCVQKYHFDSLNNQVDEYRFFIYDEKYNVLIDSVNFPTNEPCLRPDTSIITHMEFTPDGEKLFMIVKVFKEYDEGGYRIYDDQLFVWNTSDWTIHRKEEYWHSDGRLSIMPNNKMYYVFWEDTYPQEVDCYFFRDMEVDTNIYELCEDETSYYSGLIFPKTDTTKFINFVYDKTDFKTRIQVRNQSDISLIKTIDNDTLKKTYNLMLSNDCQYMIFVNDNYISENYYFFIYDIFNEYIVYKYPIFPFTGKDGPDANCISNNSSMFFDGWARTLRMYNAKYTTTSAEEKGEEPSSMLYPNPATDYVEIYIPPLERGLGGVAPVVRVFNVLGIEHPVSTMSFLRKQESPVNTDEIPGQAGNDSSIIRLDVSHLPPGVYFVQIGSRVQRFVKM